MSGCRDAFVALNGSGRAQADAEQAFTALAERHGEQARNAKYDYARLHVMRAALSPSRVYDDTAAWTTFGTPTRKLETHGSVVDGHYALVARANAPAPVKPADGKHITALTRVSDNEYRWDASVDFALGNVRPGEVAALMSRLIASAEGRTEHDVLTDIRASAPRTSAVMGTVFSLDSVRPVVHADGSTAVTLGIGVHSDALRRRSPAFAEYVRKYVEPARYRFVLTDRAGVPFLEASQRDRVLVIRARTQHGRMVPLAGPPRPMPDSLLLQADFNVKIRIFHVGFHNLVMEFVNGGVGDHEREWTVVARREPQWDLPFITARLIRAPLRRPFAGDGSMFRIGVRSADGAPTVLARQSRLYVQESALLNFLNGLGSTAMDEFGGQVEREENAWLHELFTAMREDARTVGR